MDQASRRFGIPEPWIRVVMLAESGGQLTLNGTPITSKAGAMGLMQVMPETYAEMRERYDLDIDPYDPASNIMAGSAYLAELHRRFGFPGLFAAYNAGPERYATYLLTGETLPDETISYLKSIERLGLETRKLVAKSDRNPVPHPPSLASASPLFFAEKDLSNRSIFVPLSSSTDSSQ